MSLDDSDTERIPAPTADRRHEGVSHREMMATMERMGDRLHALEKAHKERREARHAENEKMHQILGELGEQLSKHDEEIAELKEIARRTSTSLDRIQGLLEGAYGQDGLAARVKGLESWQNDAARTLWIVQTVGGWIVAPLGTAVGGAVLWLIYQSQGVSK